MGPFQRRAAALAGALVVTACGAGQADPGEFAEPEVHANPPPPPPPRPEPKPEDDRPIAPRGNPPPPPRPPAAHVVQRGVDHCVVSYDADCVAGAPCEPGPDAEPIACPSSMKARAEVQPMRILHLRDRCRAVGETRCPPGARCNPPPPEPIDCPKRPPVDEP